MEFVVRLLEVDSDPETMYRGEAPAVAGFVEEILKEPLHGMTLEIAECTELCSAAKS